MYVCVCVCVCARVCMCVCVRPEICWFLTKICWLHIEMILRIVLQWEKCTLRRKRRKSWFQSKRSFESHSFYGNGWFSIHVLTTAAVRNQYLEQDWWGRVWLTPIRLHDDVIKWKHFPCYLPFVRGTTDHPLTKAVTRSFDVFFDGRLNKRLSKQSKRHRAHYDFTVMPNILCAEQWSLNLIPLFVSFRPF